MLYPAELRDHALAHSKSGRIWKQVRPEPADCGVAFGTSRMIFAAIACMVFPPATRENQIPAEPERKPSCSSLSCC